MKTIPKALVLGLLVEPGVFGLMLFLAAGTFNYWQGTGPLLEDLMVKHGAPAPHAGLRS